MSLFGKILEKFTEINLIKL